MSTALCARQQWLLQEMIEAESASMGAGLGSSSEKEL